MTMDKPNEQSETGCCPRFNPEVWEEKEITWQDNLFVKDHIRSFLHIPLNFGKVVTKNTELIKAADAITPASLMLSDESSLWGSDVYIAVSKEVPQAKNVRISGTFLTKVLKGTTKTPVSGLKR